MVSVELFSVVKTRKSAVLLRICSFLVSENILFPFSLCHYGEFPRSTSNLILIGLPQADSFCRKVCTRWIIASAISTFPPQADSFCRKVCEMILLSSAWGTHRLKLILFAERFAVPETSGISFKLPPQADSFCRKVCPIKEIDYGVHHPPPQADSFCRKVCQENFMLKNCNKPPQADSFCRKVCGFCLLQYCRVLSPPQADSFCRKVCQTPLIHVHIAVSASS